jgi:tetratricopeptide (TPR) repeat protein
MKACKDVSPLPPPPPHWKTPVDIEFSFDLNVHYGRVPVADVPAAYKDLNERLAAATNQVSGGWQALRQGHTGAALKIFNDNLDKLNKQSWEASVVLAGRGMCYLLSDQPAKAAPDFTRALSLLPLSEYEKIRSANMEALVSIDYNGLFVAHLLDNQLAEAIKDDCELAKFQTDERLRMYAICGLAYCLLERYDESIKEFDKRLQVDPGDNEARKLKAMVVIVRDGTEAEASTARSAIKSMLDERIKRGMDKMRQHMAAGTPSPAGPGSQ